MHTSNNKFHSKCWLPKEKALAITLMHLEKNMLSIFIKTVRTSTSNVELYPGFSEQLLDLFKVDGVSDKSKICPLIFDEMSPKTNVSYNQVMDMIERYEEFGHLGRTKFAANHATVFPIEPCTGWKAEPRPDPTSNHSTQPKPQPLTILKLYLTRA